MAPAGWIHIWRVGAKQKARTRARRCINTTECCTISARRRPQRPRAQATPDRDHPPLNLRFAADRVSRSVSMLGLMHKHLSPVMAKRKSPQCGRATCDTVKDKKYSNPSIDPGGDGQTRRAERQRLFSPFSLFFGSEILTCQPCSKRQWRQLLGRCGVQQSKLLQQTNQRGAGVQELCKHMYAGA